MSENVSRDNVKHIAKLARLEFTDAELDRFTGEMNAVLDHIKKLAEVDTTSVEPTSHVLDIVSVMREDVVEPGLSQDEALANAPEAEHGHFKVPRVIES